MGFASNRRQNNGSADARPPSVEHRFVPQTNRVTHSTSGASLFLARSLTLWFALLVAAIGAWNGVAFPLDGVAVCVIVILLLLLRAVPISWARERPLSFSAPVVFAALLWFGTGVAVWSALLAYLFLAFSRAAAHSSHSEVRFQGGQLALGALMSGSIMERFGGVGSRSAVLYASASHLNYSASLSLLRGAALAALTFLLVSLFLTLCIGLLADRNRLALRRRLLLSVPVYAATLLPIVLLAPLGAIIGVVVALPATLLLLVSVQAIRLHGEVTSLNKQLKTAEAMGRASVTDANTVDSIQILERFLLLAQELVKAERSLVWMLDVEKGELSPTVALPDRGPFARRIAQYGDGLIGHAATRVRPRLIPDAAHDHHRGQREAASGAWLLYPIVVRERVLGVAQWIRSANQPFTIDDIKRLDSLVPQATIAIENIQIRARMHELAATDGLTGLWNQGKMADILRDEVRRAQRYHRVISVLMLDVDSFKTFNDTYGHPQGDHLLRSIAGILRANVRAVDQVGRYGGEEFLIVLPETSKDDACRLAERLRSAVQSRDYITPDGQAVYRTLSVGVASYPEDALNPTELVQRADEALYRAKRAGKNRVTWA